MRRAGAIAALLTACGSGVLPAPDGGALPDLAIEGTSFPFVGAETCFEILRASDAPVTITWGDEAAPEEIPPGTTRACHTYPYPGPVVMGAAIEGLSRTKLLQVVFEPAAVRPAASSTIAYDAARDRVWAVEPDADLVTVIDAVALEVIARVPVGDRPRSVAIAGDRAYVACQGEGTLHAIDAAAPAPGTAIALGEGTGPVGVVADPRGGAVWATLFASGELVSIDTGSDEVRSREPVGPDPRAIAIRGDGTIAITRWRSSDLEAAVYVRDAGGTITTTALPRDETRDTDTDNKGVLSFLSSIAPSPDGGRVIVGALKANTVTGAFRTGEELTPVTTARAALAEVSLRDGRGEDTFRHRFDDLDYASALAFSPMGERLYVAMQGTEAVVVIDAFGFDAVGSIDDVGHAPDGLVTDPSGERLFVHAALSREVRAYDVRDLQVEPTALAALSTIEDEPLDPVVLRGAIVFHASRDERMTRTRYLSCASCHLDGEGDGLTWDFTQRGEGVRNTIPLRGRGGPAHGPMHWSANFDEVQDFEHDIRGGQGGLGFMADEVFHTGTRDTTLGDPKAGLSADLDALAAYVSSLASFGISPHRRDGDAAWEASRARGEALFDASGCRTCHAGASYTDSAFTAPGAPLLHDVGTLGPASGMRLGGALPGLDTPTLRGLWSSAPYLHDGSAPTLRAVLRDRNPTGAHGPATLTDAELDDLETFLLSLDDRAP